MTIDPIPREYEGREQSYIKHLVLERYLERVAYNIFSFKDNLVYVDAFAGPWKSRSSTHQDTSFLRAVNVLKRVQSTFQERGVEKKFRCLFIEKNREAYKKLVSSVSTQKIDHKTLNASFETSIEEVSDYIGDDFSFIFIDPTGWTGFALENVKPLFRRHSEVLINFMYDHINRHIPFLEVDASFATLFGTSKWKQLLENIKKHVPDDEEAIVELYRSQLKRLAKFQLVATSRVLQAAADRTHFHLVCGTNHPKGLIEFRKVEKRTLPQQAFVRASAKLDRKRQSTGQDDLFRGDQATRQSRFLESLRESRLADLNRMLDAYVVQNTAIPYDELLCIALEMPFIDESDLKTRLKELKKSGSITIEAPIGATVPRLNRGDLIHFKGSSRIRR